MSERSIRRARRGAGKTTGWYPALAVFAIALALLAVSNAVAADERCGADTDRSGAVDTLCASPDQDGDGYAASVDCDDTSAKGFYIYPGVSTGEGCSAGSWRTCQANGTYTSCAALSTFTCHSGSGTTYWIDDSVSTCAGSNAYATPSNSRCFSDSTMSNYRSPVAGDCYVYKTVGSYIDTFSSGGTKMVYVNNKDCTSTDKCKIMAAPGTAWWEVGQTAGVYIPTTAGTRGGSNEVQPIWINASDYWEVSGLEINGASGFSNAGIYWSSGSIGGRAYNNAVYNIRGDAGSNNLSGLKATGNCHSLEWDHNLAYDNFDDFDATARLNENTSNFLHMDNDEFYVHDNISYYSGADPYKGMGIKIKHPFNTDSPSGLITRNILFNSYRAAIGVSGHNNTIVRYNYIKNGGASDATGGGIVFIDLGDSETEFTNFTVEYNTLIDSAFIELIASNKTVGSHLATIRYNVISDNRGTSYPSDGTDGIIRVYDYGPASYYNDIRDNNKLTLDYNCYYNSAAVSLYFDFFQQTSGGPGPADATGAGYTGLAAWQAFGYDTNSVNDNPDFDAASRVQGTSSCSTSWGWNGSADATVSGGGTACILMRTR